MELTLPHTYNPPSDEASPGKICLVKRKCSLICKDVMSPCPSYISGYSGHVACGDFAIQYINLLPIAFINV